MNKRKRNAWIGLALIVAGLAGFLAFRPKPSDADQIKTALQNAVKASKEGRAGGVIEYLSSNVQINGTKYDINRTFTEFIRKYHPEISLGTINPKVNGDKATVTTDIDVSLLSRSVQMPNVTFTLQKEHDTAWLLFPSQDWKLTGASAPPEAYQQIVNELPGSEGLGFF